MQKPNCHFFTVLAAALCTANPLCHLVAAEASRGQIVFQDRFEGKLGEGWAWLREDATAHRVGSNGLDVRVQPGNMWGPANNARNCLVRPIPSPEASPVEISVTISNQPTAQWEQVNLVWYYGDGHMVKLGQELVTGRFSVVMGREEADRARTIGIVPLDGYQVELRLQAYKNKILGQIRTQPWERWRDVGECDLPVNGEPKASFHFYNGPKTEDHWARVNQFTVRRLKPDELHWPRVRAAESINRLDNQEAPTGIAGSLELSGTPFTLLNQLCEVSPGGAKAGLEQQIYRYKDAAFGWRWDRRAPAQKGFISTGIMIGKADIPDNSQNKALLKALPETDFSKINKLEAHLEAITRLENDAGKHNWSFKLLTASSSTGKPSADVNILLDWYGRSSEVKGLNDGFRDYERVKELEHPATGSRQFTYRISGFRGAPPKVNLKAFLDDLKRQDPSLSHLQSIWFGNEVWEGSIGATLITRYDIVINESQISSIPTVSPNIRK